MCNRIISRLEWECKKKSQPHNNFYCVSWKSCTHFIHAMKFSLRSKIGDSYFLQLNLCLCSQWIMIWFIFNCFSVNWYLLWLDANWHKPSDQTALQIKDTPHGTSKPQWHWSPSRTMHVATSQNLVRNSLGNRSKSLKIPYIQICWGYIGLSFNKSNKLHAYKYMCIIYTDIYFI